MMGMNSRQLTRLGRVVPLLIIAIGTCLTVLLLWPRSKWVPPQVDLKAAPVARPAAPKPDLDRLAVIWKRDLRQAVVDAPLPPPAAEPQFGIHLVGTAVEAQKQFGVFQLSNGAIVVKPAGASIEGCEILSVSRGQARLRRNGREYELRVPWFERIKLASGE